MAAGNSRTYSFSDSQFPPLLRAGFIELDGADLLPLGEAYFNADATEVSLSLSYPSVKAADSAFVVFKMLQLPAGEAEFRRICEWYGERKKRPKFAEGVAFEPSLLAVQGVPPLWQHDAWAHGNCDIIHTYTSPTRSMLVRWSGTKAALLTHPLLAMVHQKVRIREDQWELALPAIQPKPGHEPAFTAEAIAGPVREEINQATARARQHLGIGPGATPQMIAERVFEELNALRSNQGNLEATDPSRLAIDLGSLWGQALCDAAGWQWRSLLHAGQATATVVCSPSNSHRVNSISNLHALLKSPNKTNNSLLLFNMIVANDLPAAPAAALVVLS